MPAKHRSNSGQATVEFALVLPLFVGSILLMLAILSTCLEILALNDVARSAVRVAVTSDHPQEAIDALLQHSSTRTAVSENPNGIITVSVSRPLALWFITLPISTIRVRASASMMREPPIFLK